MNKLKNYFQTTFVFFTGAVGHQYVSKLLDYKEVIADQKSEAEIIEMNKDTNNKITEVHNHIIDNDIEGSLNEALNSSEASEAIKAQAQIAKDSIAQTKTSCMDFIKYNVSNSSNKSNEVAKALDIKKRDCFTKITNTTEELKKLQEFIDNEKNKFLSNLTGLNDYLNSLSLLELSALFHILGSLLILITAFNILSVFFSNEIIKFFNLELKYPKLAKFFHLRRIFQKYYLL